MGTIKSCCDACGQPYMVRRQSKTRNSNHNDRFLSIKDLDLENIVANVEYSKNVTDISRQDLLHIESFISLLLSSVSKYGIVDSKELDDLFEKAKSVAENME